MNVTALSYVFLIVLAAVVAGSVNVVLTRADTGPSCSVTFDQNPIDAGASTIMRWASTGASLFYIKNVGYVSASGSAQVSPAETTDYSGYATGSGDGDVITSYTMDIFQKHGGYSQWQCFNDQFSHTISPGARYLLLDSTPNGPGEPGWGKRNCMISNQGGSLSLATVTITDANGNVTYRSPTDLDCGEYYTDVYDMFGQSERLYRWTDAPRRVDLDPTGVPYTITTRGYGCNGWSLNYLTTWAGLQVSEYAAGAASCQATLTVKNGNTACTPTSYTCEADGNLRDSCGNTTTCQYGCSTNTNQCNTSCRGLRVCDAGGGKVVNACDGSVVQDCAARGEGWSCSTGACVQASIEFHPFDAWNGWAEFVASGHLQVAPALVRGGETTRVYWNVANASQCAVTGSTGDVWHDMFSGSAGKISGPINERTTYTLLCSSLSGAIPPSILETAVVNILPVWTEQ